MEDIIFIGLVMFAAVVAIGWFCFRLTEELLDCVTLWTLTDAQISLCHSLSVRLVRVLLVIPADLRAVCRSRFLRSNGGLGLMRRVILRIVAMALYFPALIARWFDAISTEKMDIVLIQTLLFVLLAETIEK